MVGSNKKDRIHDVSQSLDLATTAHDSSSMVIGPFNINPTPSVEDGTALLTHVSQMLEQVRTQFTETQMHLQTLMEAQIKANEEMQAQIKAHAETQALIQAQIEMQSKMMQQYMPFFQNETLPALQLTSVKKLRKDQG